MCSLRYLFIWCDAYIKSIFISEYIIGQSKYRNATFYERIQGETHFPSGLIGIVSLGEIWSCELPGAFFTSTVGKRESKTVSSFLWKQGEISKISLTQVSTSSTLFSFITWEGAKRASTFLI